MTSTPASGESATGTSAAGTSDLKIEVIVIPVSDVDRARDFYVGLGWRLDVTPPSVVQLTPPGSGCSVQFGEAFASITSAEPGSSLAYLVVSDIVAARDALVAAGADVSDFFHLDLEKGLVEGLDPERRSYVTRATMTDPDGNKWLLQEVTTRLPGRVDSKTTEYASVSDLSSAMRRAALAHGEHEQRTGETDENWPDWYAEYMVAEHAGTELPT